VPRAVRLVAWAALAVAAVLLFARIFDFGQHRFFTIDEYQYGHATWLVSQGQRPYVDFYEHHTPLSYALHAPLLPGDGSFSARARWLRRVPFAWMLALAGVVGVAVWTTTRDPWTAALCAIVPFGVGFSLMSAVDYRADNFAACLWLACLVLLEANRRLARRDLAALCGALLAAAVLTTQKLAVLGGGTVALWLAADALRLRRGSPAVPLLRRPLAFAAGAGAVAAAACAALAALGMLRAAFEITVLQALRHEAYYPPDPVWPFLAPYLAETAVSTAAMLAFVAVFFALSRSGFWLAPLAAALAAGAAVAGQYPYNYVFLGWLLGFLAVRGFGLAVDRTAPPPALRPLVFLLPLLVLPDQTGFVSGRTTNEHQLALLDKIERNTREGDAVIDNAGGALFRPHASYHWYHGFAHRRMFADVFERELVDDYRRSAAPLWIEDGRLYQLPQTVQDYFHSHYVRADGSLHALGFVTPETARRERKELVLDVVRPGEYHVFPVQAPLAGGRPGGLQIDGSVVSGGVARLDAGPHPVTVLPSSPRYIVSLMPRSFFQDRVSDGAEHSMLFEYERPD